jgi:hypothetical protein
MLTNDQIEKFRALYKKRFGKEIGKEDAQEKAERFMRLMKLIGGFAGREEHTIRDRRKAQRSKNT